MLLFQYRLNKSSTSPPMKRAYALCGDHNPSPCYCIKRSIMWNRNIHLRNRHQKAWRRSVVDVRILQFHTDTYHPPLVTDSYLPSVSCTQYYECSHRKYASGHCKIFSRVLTGMHDTNSVDVFVVNHNATV
jgi:hypothetical protein